MLSFVSFLAEQIEIATRPYHESMMNLARAMVDRVQRVQQAYSPAPAPPPPTPLELQQEREHVLLGILRNELDLVLRGEGTPAMPGCKVEREGRVWFRASEWLDRAVSRWEGEGRPVQAVARLSEERFEDYSLPASAQALLAENNARFVVVVQGGLWNASSAFWIGVFPQYINTDNNSSKKE